MSEIEKCRKCGEPYWINEIGGQMPGTSESENISCPHCGDTFTRRSNGTFSTGKLPPEAEKAWRGKQETE